MALSKQEFSRRRKALIEMMGAGSIAILPSAHEKARNRDVHFPFRQDSDFQYLCGFPEPDAVLAIIPGREHGECVLFCKERNPERELWDGAIVGPERAPDMYGVDDSFPISDIDDILPGLIEGRDKVFYSMGFDAQFDARLMEWINVIRSKVRNGAHPPGEFVALEHHLHELRLFKSAEEIKLMDRAAKISCEGHRRAMKRSHAGAFEYQLEATLVHAFMEEGARAVAYPSIVGSGDNACVLHYRDNMAELKEGDLILIDAGCEVDHYASDITRTFPVNGRFSAEQAALYQVVLDAQLAAIAEVKPGNHWNHPHDAAVRVITEGLVRLGLLQGTVDDLIANESYKPFYMHRTGHWLGMDVHDVGDYKVGGEWRVLEPGMVMTVEPGIYVAPDCAAVEARWRGIGIRIEDDVVVTKEGCRVLTEAAPKEISEIEALMAG
ncbi:MAG: Xaa-Pro aminopeptidase [Hahellaceae bacterium]|nr:Xaa-Pro aminopeptidase [Hahellaceae bacterium]MCP5168622.1 Xaa-Pro aminopeptidase [Hahellaceae bacterium]